MPAKGVAAFMVFMIIIYAFGLWVNIYTHNLVQQQTLEYTHRQLNYLAESLDQEIENIARQLIALNNDFALRRLLLYPDTSNMGSIFNHLRRISIHLNAIYASTPHVSCVGVYMANMDRLTRWGLHFSAPTEYERDLISTIQNSDSQIFPYKEDLLLGMSLLGGLSMMPEAGSPISYVRLSGEAIQRTLNQMALAYDLTIILYNEGKQILTVNHSTPSSYEILRASFPRWDFEFVALMPNNQDTVIPTMVATMLVFVFSLIIGLACFALYVNHLIKQIFTEKQVSERAKMGQLHLKITPHFLYNSFYQIYRLGKIGDMDTVSEMSLKLSQFYQYITRSEEGTSTLESETKHAKDYVAIQDLRFGGRVECLFEPIPELSGEIKMPTLFLQPIIENAYIHGMENNGGVKLINVGFAYSRNELRIWVEDDGTLEISALERLKKYLADTNPAGDVSGLLNIKRRLMFMYGDKTRMEVSKGELGGLRVELSIEVK